MCALCLLQLLQELEPYMQQALDAVRQAALEDMIFGFRCAVAVDEASCRVAHAMSAIMFSFLVELTLRAMTFVRMHEAGANCRV
jgi:hypothetical protein